MNTKAILYGIKPFLAFHFLCGSFSQAFCPSTDGERIFRLRLNVCKNVQQCVSPCDQSHDSSYAPHHNTFVSAITEESIQWTGSQM